MSDEAAVAADRFSADAFLARARLRLEPEPRMDDARAGGDHRVDPGMPAPERAKSRDAAVLVPVVRRDGEATVLLTQRTDHLSTHAGQIAFPGGRIDAEDASPLAAALREADEEIGLKGSVISPIGHLHPYYSGTGYRIVPVVAMVEPGFDLVLNAFEVKEAFEVPLGFLMNPANHQHHSKMWRGQQRTFYAMPYGERYIWGVTAGILRNLFEEVYGS
ncbi:MAG: CoA pyrophosphatase [Hyphomicrobiales bacterium]